MTRPEELRRYPLILLGVLALFGNLNSHDGLEDAIYLMTAVLAFGALFLGIQLEPSRRRERDEEDGDDPRGAAPR